MSVTKDPALVGDQEQYILGTRTIAAETALKALLTDRPVAYHPMLAHVFGGVQPALLLSQLLYWSPRADDPTGWVYKTQTEWETELGLSRREQEHARRLLKSHGVLEEKRAGMPARLYYRVDWTVLTATLARMSESANQECPIPPNKCGGKRQSLTITENTTETTTEYEQPLDLTLYPVWFGIARTVPGWVVKLADAELWRMEANVSEDLAEKKAYALRDWFTPDKLKRGRNPYATWQNWCRQDRDQPARQGNGPRRPPDDRTEEERNVSWGR